jgi:hypothetical protein
VKTWEDADAALVDTTPRPTTISALAALEIPEVPYPANARLAPVERTRYVVRAQIARLTTEEDGDWHAAVRDSLRRVPRQGMAVVHGIGFWDFLHTQKGGAANGIELHPIVLVIPTRVP